MKQGAQEYFQVPLIFIKGKERKGKRKMTMTIQETSKYLGLNEFTTYRLVKNGKIPAVKKEDGQWLVDKNKINGLFDIAMETYKSSP